MTNDRLHDPFNPKTGKFADNIRARGADDLADLLQSMQRWGWLKHFPAIQDENGVTLVGHRRLRAAAKLGIDPVIEKFSFGQGDEADAERLKLAIASNIGFKQMTRDDRKRIAEYLYGQREWTMEKIAEALDVSARTVSTDLEGFEATSKPPRPKGGRPKGSGKRTGPKPERHKNPAVIEQAAAILVLDKGYTRKQAAEELEIGEKVVQLAMRTEQGRRDATIPPDLLSMTAQQKLTAAIRQHQHRLDAEFDVRVREEIKRRIDEMYLPAHHKILADAQEVLKTYRQKGIFTSAQFKKIVSCLHPDRVRDAELKDRYAEAFNLVNAKKLSLVSEVEEPTQPAPGFPKTYQELMELRRKTSEMRKAKRTSGNSPAVRH